MSLPVSLEAGFHLFGFRVRSLCFIPSIVSKAASFAWSKV